MQEHTRLVKKKTEIKNCEKMDLTLALCEALQ